MGRVFRDDRGAWIIGYYGKFPPRTSLEAELWGIFKGLKMVIEQGMTQVDVETDSQVALKLIQNDPSSLPSQNPGERLERNYAEGQYIHSSHSP